MEENEKKDGIAINIANYDGKDPIEIIQRTGKCTTSS